MSDRSKTKYMLVDTAVLPDVFLKVVEAKELLAKGGAKNASQASQMAGISRSAFYKYKDCVFAYSQSGSHNMLTITASLRDEPGVLSRFTSQLYDAGCNILTVNQNIPVDGVALVSISGRGDKIEIEISELLSLLKQVDGVVDAKIVAGR